MWCKYISRSILILLVALQYPLLMACEATDLHGNFGWANVDDRGIEEPERSLLVASEFRIQRKNLYFYDYETIWWTYQISGSFYDKDQFLAALYENNNTPDPVLFDLRRLQLVRGNRIRQKYEQLEIGRYLLKIAYKSREIDQVEFNIVPPQGPRGVESHDGLDEDQLEFDNQNIDDIELYSGS